MEDEIFSVEISIDQATDVRRIAQKRILELGSILAQVKNDAAAHKQYLVKNESATRQSLIDPVLRALGWDTTNPRMVVVEAAARRGVNIVNADYGLCSDDKVKIVVEAKALGQNLEIHRDQIVGYAYAFQVTNLFLTNGVIWEHYTSNSFNPKHFVPARIFNLANDDLSTCAAYLISELQVSPTPQTDGSIDEIYQQAGELLTWAGDLLGRAIELEKALLISRQPPVAALSEQLIAMKELLNTNGNQVAQVQVAQVDANSFLAQVLIAYVKNQFEVLEKGFFKEASEDLHHHLLQFAAMGEASKEQLENIENDESYVNRAHRERAKFSLIDRHKESLLKSHKIPADNIRLSARITQLAPSIRKLEGINCLPTEVSEPHRGSYRRRRGWSFAMSDFEKPKGESAEDVFDL
ncbi:MAG TPA: hypothetical protein VGB77_04605 [Abditibacteriaceae bacterium]|jgi:hypothetical protein